MPSTCPSGAHLSAAGTSTAPRPRPAPTSAHGHHVAHPKIRRAGARSDRGSCRRHGHTSAPPLIEDAADPASDPRPSADLDDVRRGRREEGDLPRRRRGSLRQASGSRSGGRSANGTARSARCPTGRRRRSSRRRSPRLPSRSRAPAARLRRTPLEPVDRDVHEEPDAVAVTARRPGSRRAGLARAPRCRTRATAA